MLLEKSSFHISKTSVQPSEDLKKGSNAENINVDKDQNSFWSWFKGLVNPFQNLPIISGIYSSMNSENPDSDRDLVQNSLGGFLYGGPIGAIAGFGNWVFNKLFDKTPTEFAFDFSGVSNIWKKKNDTNIEKANNELEEDFKKTSSASLKQIESRETSNRLSARQLIEPRETSNRLSARQQNNQRNLVKKGAILPIDLSKTENLQNNKTPKLEFRKIEFKYPEWTPPVKISEQSNPLNKPKKYFYDNMINSDQNVEKRLFNIDA